MKFLSDAELPSLGSGIGKDSYLKLEAGRPIVVAFRGDPADFRTHWVSNRYALCTGDGCQPCKDGIASAFRFRVNVIVKEGGQALGKVWEGGRVVYNSLRDLNKDYDLATHLIKLTRNGTGKETTYSLLPAPKGEITPEMEKLFKTIQLFDLDKAGKKEDKPKTFDETENPADLQTPFDDDALA